MNPFETIFSQHCLHCDSPSTRLFCETCTLHLGPIDPSIRCPVCFSEYETMCTKCLRQKRKHIRAAVFDRASPMMSLYHEMQKGRLHIYEKSILAYLFIQWSRLGWKVDLITPLFESVFHKVFQGPSLSRRLLKPFASRIHVPCRNLFTVVKGELSQVFAKEGAERMRVLILSDRCVESSYIRALYAQKAKEVSVLQIFY